MTFLTTVRGLLARFFSRPQRLLSLHSLAWAVAALPLALLLYTLALIPTTPSICFLSAPN